MNSDVRGWPPHSCGSGDVFPPIDNISFKSGHKFEFNLSMDSGSVFIDGTLMGNLSFFSW